MAGKNGAHPELERLATWTRSFVIDPAKMPAPLRPVAERLELIGEVDNPWGYLKDELRRGLGEERGLAAYDQTRAAAGFRGAPTMVAPAAAPTVPRFVFLTADEVKSLPPPAFVVGDMLVRNSLAEIYGATATFKSFLALGIALDVAAGLATLGREVLGGWVLYVSAEGSAGMGQRIRAWEIDRGRAAPARCRFLLDQPQLLDGDEVAALSAAIAALPEPPVLIVLDTLARVTVGAEENSTKDMGLVVAAADRLRRETGACVALLHHPNRAGTNPRGAYCIDAAMDTMVEVKREGDIVTALCAKQKDAADFAPILLRRRVVDLDGQYAGTTSVVLEPADERSSALSAAAQQIARLLWECFKEDGASSSAWLKVCAPMPDRTHYRARAELLDAGYVANADPGKRGARYRVTVAWLVASGEMTETPS